MRYAKLGTVATALVLGTACGGLTTSAPPATTGLETPGTTNTGGGGGGGGGTTATGTGTGTGTGGGTATGGTGTGTGTGGTLPAGDGGNFAGPYATNATTNCNLDATQLNDVATLLAGANFGWTMSIGGPIHTDVQTWAAGQLTPADQFWGAQLYGSYINPSPMEGLSYGFETDATNALITPQTPVPLTNTVTNNGLADGYYEVVTPYLLSGVNSWTAGHIAWAETLTIEAYLAVDGGTIVDFSIDGSTVNSVIAFNFGDVNWNGDLQGTGNFCSVWLDLTGRTVTPN